MAMHYELKRTWRYADALGDTVMEKYESLYIFLMGLKAELGGELDCLICGRTFGEWFQNSTVFKPDPLCEGIVWPPDYTPPIRSCFRLGSIHDFDVIVDMTMPEGHMYVLGKHGLRKVEVPDWMM